MQTSVETPRERDKPKKLLDRMRDVMRLKHYSFRTEQTYCDWVERFIRFHRLRHPSELGEAEVSEFLTHLAREGNVAASTQNQALSALLFVYKKVLKLEIGWLEGVERPKKPVRVPVVLTRDEVHKIFAYLHGREIGRIPYQPIVRRRAFARRNLGFPVANARERASTNIMPAKK